ncbi:MAG TPA: acetate--CoA ligase family protein [Anaerolineae bacterium]|nr:acetate--CoA ligase family protein [Anaerolineae bacterium]
MRQSQSLDPFFIPKGVAVIGASSNPAKLSHGILKNLSQYGYQGKIYPVNPSAQEILGYQCYEDISHVPDPVDLGVIVLPAKIIPNVLKACGQRGIQAAIIISGGFKEVGKQGSARELECLAIADNFQMRLIGPNCVGTMNLYNGLNTTFIKGMPAKGGIGFLSQSGAVCGGIVDHIVDVGIGFSHFISLGNEADVTETDIIEYLSDDDHTRVIAAYVEAISDGRRFLDICRRVSRRKPIVVLKAGCTDAGAKAVSSHTGSLAGSQQAYRAAFRQGGLIEVHTVEQLLDVAMTLDFQPLPKGKKVALITNSGGPAALISDGLAIAGLEMAELNGKTQSKLRAKLNPAAQVNNPVDMLGGAGPDDFRHALTNVLADRSVDTVVSILVPQSLVNPTEVAKAIVEQANKSNKPILSCLMGKVSIKGANNVLHDNKVPMFDFPNHVGPVLGAMWQYSNYIASKAGNFADLKGIKREKANKILNEYKNQTPIGEAGTRPVLAAYGISLIQAEFAENEEKSIELAGKIGFPVALKVISKEILHKSDAGGIKLNLRNSADVQQGYQEIMRSCKSHQPNACIDGVLVEKMSPAGQEVIIGLKRDPNFGPLVMFGMGGVYVELLKDVAFRVAPLTEQEATQMIEGTFAGKLLQGYRGNPPADKKAIVDCILRLSQIAMDFPQIAEIEINPLLVLEEGSGVLALDCRMILN